MAAPKTEKRKRKPKILAWINDNCTGCAGSPVCQDLCPVEDCMVLVANEAAPIFNRIWVDPLKCIG
ncbi:MAG TPA: 4Fe-4S ferredoxin, partial [Planctomycetota bacterium]|nr:4Fe-4S ferredoxin [Planctomycetota bacterium]